MKRKLKSKIAELKGGTEMTEQKLSAGIEISKMEKGQWSFGVCFSHYFDETYLYINLIKWTITTGKFWR